MTLLATLYNRAANGSARLPIARDIFAEVRAERTEDSPADAQTIAQGPHNAAGLTADSSPEMDALERSLRVQIFGTSKEAR